MTANRIETQNPAAHAALVSQLLRRAGTTSLNGTNGAVGATVVRGEAVNTIAAKNDTQINLGPVTAPLVTMSSVSAAGAKSFAHNVDRVLTSHLNLMSTAFASSSSALTSTTPDLTAPNLMLPDPTAPDPTLAQSNPIMMPEEPGTAEAPPTSAGTPQMRINPGAATTILSMLRSNTSALTNGVVTKAVTQQELRLVNVKALSSDQLLAEFLKININDPNQNVQTQDKLYNLASKMRILALEEAKKKIERAEELMKEAQKYADQVEQYAQVASMVGIAAAFLGPLGAILSAIMQIVMAIAQYTAQMKIEDAKEEKNNGERYNLMADQHQNQVKETADVINTIMEHKNQMVDSVIKMMTESFTTQQQLMSAAIAR